jgi:pheromone shutdown protein TraB
MSSTENTENIPQAIAQNEENQNPDTLVVLNGPLGSKLYLVGTAHFSIESQREVSNIIQKVRPNCVVLELCSNRVNILKLDEETVLREAKEMNVNKMLALIKEV